MIISIRYISSRWHWELYTIDKDATHVSGKYANGISETWKDMISNLEVNISELEKKHET